MNLNPEDQKTLDRIVGRFDFADNRVHRKFRQRCDEQYALYCNYDSLKARLAGALTASERERVLGDGQNQFGASMFIPFIYSTIETILPRMAANAPVPRLQPAQPGLEQNAINMQALLMQQLPKMKYSLSIQDTGKHGLLHGLGVRKDTWLNIQRKTRKLVKMERGGVHIDESWGSIPTNRTVYDDPMSADIDPRDWIFDPFGSSMRSIEWCIHRTWRSTEYVKGKFDCEEWKIPEGVERDEALRQTKDDEYQKVWQGRADVIGLESYSPSSNSIHEVWEFHDGAEIIVILDRCMPVARRENPHWHGEMPFTIYRPVSLPGEMIGRSVVDALEDLNLELNTLRAQRRDNASQALETPMAYRIGKVDPTMIRWGRGYAIPVDGEPDAALKQLRVNDVPASSYQEENGLKDDIQRTAGVLDISGGSNVTETATGAQLVYSEANQRIQNMVKRLEEETIVSDLDLFVQMNQQHKINFAVQVPEPAPPPMPGQPDSRWRWITGDANDLAGNFLPSVEPGSTAASNTPQMRNDAQIWAQLFQNPYIDKRLATEKILQLLGVDQPNSYMVNEQQIPATVPEEMSADLERQGVDPSQVQAARDSAMEPHDNALAQSQQLAPNGVG